MSAFVLDQSEINVLTQATDAMLRLSKQYPGSYPLHADTMQLLGRYAGDLHSLYRALYITNIKAVNGRYGEDMKTLPKYKPLHPWNVDRFDGMGPDELKQAARCFGSYMYQCAEEPVYKGPAYNAFYDVYKLLCMVYMKYFDE